MAEIHALPGLSRLSEAVDKAMEEEGMREPKRDYMGISSLGHPCDRRLWLTFHWASADRKAGRICRLLERGKAEEAPMCAYLAMAGLELEHILDGQLEADFGGHVKGHPDGIVRSGVPEAPKTVHVLEIKTHNKASFDELAKKGVREAKPEHWAQMQCEMLGASMALGEDIQRALYVAVCKDDDRLHTERVTLDREEAERLIARGKRLATEDMAPPKMSERPEWHVCRMCPHHALCHEGGVPEVNCRTCGFFSALPDGTCRCERWDSAIPVEQQRKAQPCHVFNPDIVPWRCLPVGKKGCVTFEHPVMGTVVNGQGGYRSEDLKAVAEGRRDTEGFELSESIPF